jgi:TolB-like protein
MAREDPFGRDIKLGNGNVASRILPVKIHDIDAEDISLLENELGGTLRSIDFIFKSPGINRPLKPNDDRAANTSHIYYRDQINKVANAVKEIIRGLIQPSEDRLKIRSINSNEFSTIIEKITKEKSIAVLPFTDMSPTRDQEYLGDGLAEELMTMLSQIKELKVAGRTSSFSYKNKNSDLISIGKELNVDNILEGSIQKIDNRVRIKVQLVSATDGFHIWSQRYDNEMNDIFALQDEICENISEHLKITLLDEREKVAEKRPTKNIKAYELFLKGDFYCKKYSEKGFERAGEYFKEAIELDPQYADAWWYLGFVNYEMHGWLYLQKERLEMAVNCAKKAIEVDTANPYGHFLLALIHFTSGYDWAKAEAEIELGNKYIRTQFPTFSYSLEP